MSGSPERSRLAWISWAPSAFRNGSYWTFRLARYVLYMAGQRKSRLVRPSKKMPNFPRRDRTYMDPVCSRLRRRFPVYHLRTRVSLIDRKVYLNQPAVDEYSAIPCARRVSWHPLPCEGPE